MTAERRLLAPRVVGKWLMREVMPNAGESAMGVEATVIVHPELGKLTPFITVWVFEGCEADCRHCGASVCQHVRQALVYLGRFSPEPPPRGGNACLDSIADRKIA